MAVVVEDGSIVTGANSYNTLAELRAYALARGVTLSADDTVLETQSTKAMDYFESFRDLLQGSKSEPLTQELQFPRLGVYIDGVLIDGDVIPTLVKSVQSQIVMEVHAGVTLQPTSKGGVVTKRKVGPIEREFSDKYGRSDLPRMRAVNSLLDQLLISSGGRCSKRTLRV